MTSADPLFERVVFGVDFASASLAAARWATKYVAHRTNALLSHIVPFPELLGGDEDASLHAERGPMLSVLTGGLGGFAATLDLATFRAILRIGKPSHWLATIANQAQASLVVLGRRKRVSRDWVGEPNVAERIADSTSASILMVPEGQNDKPAHIVAMVDDSPTRQAIVRVAEALAQMNSCALTLLTVGSVDLITRPGSMIVAAKDRAHELLTRSAVPVLLLAS